MIVLVVELGGERAHGEGNLRRILSFLQTKCYNGKRVLEIF
jgi:hypothetical protein